MHAGKENGRRTINQKVRRTETETETEEEEEEEEEEDEDEEEEGGFRKGRRGTDSPAG